ncbi:MAG: gliding motility-associated C-terminal domain-containing protein, partial [Bacteroidota bacterium]
GVYSRDTLNIDIGQQVEQAMATDTLRVCDSLQLHLQATAALTGNTGTWLQSTDQSALGVSIVNPNDPNSRITGLQPGEQYLFTWLLSNDICPATSSINSRVLIDDGRIMADAGIDQDVCGDASAILMATEAEGNWTTTDKDLRILNDDMSVTEVQQLKVGENIFVWTAGNGACGTTSDEVTIRYEERVDAIDDEAEIKFTEDIAIDVLSNDEVANNVMVSIKTLPSRGRVIVDNNQIIYAPDAGYRGADELAYEICNETCPDICDIGIVKIDVDNLFSCTVPTIFTPNNDGVNDFFKILCLEEGTPYVNNSVRIYNQWGDEVFRAAPYGNDWQGTYDGANLPSGTYFYIVDFGDGEVPQSGFVVLER